MIDYNKFEKSELIEFTIKGHFTKEEYYALEKQLKSDTNDWDSLNVLEVIEDFEGMDFEALVEDVKFAFKNMDMIKKVKKCAFVADEKWMQAIAKTADPLISGEVKSFNLSEKENAKNWLIS